MLLEEFVFADIRLSRLPFGRGRDECLRLPLASADPDQQTVLIDNIEPVFVTLKDCQ
jgi:hypothetical protein